MPAAIRERIGLGASRTLLAWQRTFARTAGRAADRLVLQSNPAVQACRRLGLPDDYLYAHPLPRPPASPCAHRESPP